jgi:hypothetical protein
MYDIQNWNGTLEPLLLLGCNIFMVDLLFTLW